MFSGEAGHRPVRREHGPDTRHLEHEVVRELEELAVGAEAVVERLREDERVGDQRAAGVVADEHTGPLGGTFSRPRTSARNQRPPSPAAREAFVRCTQDHVARRIGGRWPTREMPRVGGMNDVSRDSPEHQRVRVDRAEHPAIPWRLRTTVARSRRCTDPWVVSGIERLLVASDDRPGARAPHQ